MGFGEGSGKIVIAFSEQSGLSYETQVRSRIGVRSRPDPMDPLVDGDGWIIEAFSLPANLMLAASSEPILPSFEAALSRMSAIWAASRTA